MPLPVSLDEVADEIDLLMDEMTAYINRKTGEIASISSDDMALVEEGEDEEDLPDWQVEILPRLREIASGEDWLELPSKLDIHEWEIMRKFADSLHDGPLAAQLQQAIRGKGAFRTFRSIVEHAGAENTWYQFKRQSLREIAKEALEDLGIPYR